MDEKNLGEKIRERRKLLKLTQGQLAKAMLVSTDYISRIEKGERTPSDRVRIDLDDFLAGRGRFAELGTGKEKAAESGGKSSEPYRIVGIRETPVLGRISAGFPNLAVQEVIEYIAIPGTPEGLSRKR